MKDGVQKLRILILILTVAFIVGFLGAFVFPSATKCDHDWTQWKNPVIGYSLRGERIVCIRRCRVCGEFESASFGNVVGGKTDPSVLSMPFDDEVEQ
jgi:hypothetical protein